MLILLSNCFSYPLPDNIHSSQVRRRMANVEATVSDQEVKEKRLSYGKGPCPCE